MTETQETKPASTPKGERRRRALIEAAAELLTDGGFDAVSHRAVAQRAGVALASTTYYFDSLDELVAAAVEYQGRVDLARAERRWQELPAAERTSPVMADLVVEHLLGPRQAEETSDYEAVLCRYERLVATGRRPTLRPVSREQGDEMRALLLDLLNRSGFVLDKAAVSRLIAVVDGTVLNALIELDPHPREAAARALRAELDG